MESSSKLLLSIMVVLILFTIAQTYWKTMVTHDFLIIDDAEEEFSEAQI